MNPLTIIQTLTANKHTSISGVIYITAKFGTQILAVWYPDHKAQLESTANYIEGAAVAYGLFAAGDAAKSAQSHTESQKQIAELQLRSNLAPNAIESGDTSQLRRVPITPAAVPPPSVPGIDPPNKPV